MVFFNYATRQATAKIVYYGPGLCGKTTNLLYIHKKTAAGSRGEMVSLETDTDRTLFFDLLPLEVGTVGGMRVRIQLYTVPGQVFYNTTRKLVLRGADGIVFVADSQAAMGEANVQSFRGLEENLAELGLSVDQVPLVFQYNKRDLRSIVPIEQLEKELNPGRRPHVEAAAVHGLGVFETLKSISRLALTQIHAKLAQLPPERQAPPLEFAAAVDQRSVAPSAVATHDAAEIQRALAALRAQVTAHNRRPPPRRSPTELEERLEQVTWGTGAGRMTVTRRAVVDVPESLLRPGASMSVRLDFRGPEGEGQVPAGIEIRLPAGERTGTVLLRADVELRPKKS